jgi:choline dehydrogenase
VSVRRVGPDELGMVHRGFLDACAASGYSPVSDHNAPAGIGAGLVPSSTVGGVRQSTARTCLARARGRRNLTIRGGALVDRLVVVDGRVVGRATDPAAAPIIEVGLLTSSR